MMRAVQRIEKEQEPEAKHREEVAVDRAPRGGGDYKIDNRERQRGDEQANGIVNPQTAESSSARARHQLGNKVSHGIGQQSKDQASDDVPAGDVEIFETARKKWREELHQGQH